MRLDAILKLTGFVMPFTNIVSFVALPRLARAPVVLEKDTGIRKQLEAHAEPPGNARTAFTCAESVKMYEKVVIHISCVSIFQ